MNNEEAKFILAAYRPDGQDAGDLTFNAALLQAAQDPQLQAWFKAQREFDAAFAVKVQQITPPAGLREAILTGVRVSATPTRRRTRPSWTWAAAGFLVLLAATAVIYSRITVPTEMDFTAQAMKDLAHAGNEHGLHSAELVDIQERFANAQLPITESLELNVDELRRRGCRTVNIAGRHVIELCLRRDDTLFHLYVARKDEFAPAGDEPHPMLQVQGQCAAVVWRDFSRVFVLVTNQGDAGLRRLL